MRRAANVILFSSTLVSVGRARHPAASAVQIALAFLHRELRRSTEPVIRGARVTLAPTRRGQRSVLTVHPFTHPPRRGEQT